MGRILYFLSVVNAMSAALQAVLGNYEIATFNGVAAILCMIAAKP